MIAVTPLLDERSIAALFDLRARGHDLVDRRGVARGDRRAGRRPRCARLPPVAPAARRAAGALRALRRRRGALDRGAPPRRRARGGEGISPTRATLAALRSLGAGASRRCSAARRSSDRGSRSTRRGAARGGGRSPGSAPLAGGSGSSVTLAARPAGGRSSAALAAPRSSLRGDPRDRRPAARRPLGDRRSGAARGRRARLPLGRGPLGRDGGGGCGRAPRRVGRRARAARARPRRAVLAVVDLLRTGGIAIEVVGVAAAAGAVGLLVLAAREARQVRRRAWTCRLQPDTERSACGALGRRLHRGAGDRPRRGPQRRLLLRRLRARAARRA